MPAAQLPQIGWVNVEVVGHPIPVDFVKGGFERMVAPATSAICRRVNPREGLRMRRPRPVHGKALQPRVKGRAGMTNARDRGTPRKPARALIESSRRR